MIVCPLTTRHRGLSLHVEVEPSDATGLDQASYVQCEVVRSINLRRLVHQLGSIGIETSQQIEQILRTLMNC